MATSRSTRPSGRGGCRGRASAAIGPIGRPAEEEEQGKGGGADAHEDVPQVVRLGVGRGERAAGGDRGAPGGLLGGGEGLGRGAEGVEEVTREDEAGEPGDEDGELSEAEVEPFLTGRRLPRGVL